MTVDPWQTLGAKLPGEDEENDRMEIAGFADQYNADLDGEVLVEEVPAEGVPPPRFAAAEAESPPDEEEGTGLADAQTDFTGSHQPAQTPLSPVAPVSIAPVKSAAPKMPAPAVPGRSAQSVRAPQKIIPSPEVADRGPVDEEEGEQERGPGVSGPRMTESVTAQTRRSSWPLVAAIAGAVTLLAGAGTVAFLKSAQPPHEPMIHPLPAPPGVTNMPLPPRQPTAPATPQGAPGMPVESLQPASTPLSPTAAFGTPGSAPNPVSSPQSDAAAASTTAAAGSLSASSSPAVTPSPTPASSRSIASQLARLERSFRGITFLVGQITRKESALAAAIQKEQTTSVRDAVVIARQGREIAHLTWLVHHAPRITVRPLASPKPKLKPKPKPKPLVPPVQLVGIIGHAAWIEVPNGALVRIFRGNPIPGMPKLSVRSIQANPPLLVLSNGAHLREAGP